MFSSVKVRRREYAVLQQAQLASFAANVVRRTVDVPVYAPVKTPASALQAAWQTYQDALADNLRTGVAQTILKNQAKKALIDALHVLAGAVEQQAGGDPMYVIHAGFSLWKPRVPHTGAVLPPYNLRACGTGRRGEVRLSFERSEPALVRSYAMQYSADNGESWHNGTYGQRNNLLLSGLPHCPALQIRVSILASRNRQSDWSEPVVVAVA